MNKILKIFVGLFILASMPKIALAHCPLCTVGAGALAIFAASIGVSSSVVGILIGAFALALGLWIANSIKKTYIPLQKTLIVFIVYISTIIPLMPLVKDYYPLYVSIFGKYGTLLHNTYTINLFLWGAIVGAIVMFIAKPLSRLITRANGGKLLVSRQGPMLSFIMLLIISIIAQALF